MPARRKSGFTLIELLVVIAIIAILAAILFPVFARAREAARKSQCSSNIKELAIALQTYWTDYDATLPSSVPAGSTVGTNGPGTDTGFVAFASKLGVIPTPATATPQTWPQMLYPHMKNKDIMFCPSDSADKHDANAIVSYWWKFAIDKGWRDGTMKCQKEGDFGFNADQICFYERAGFHSNAQQGLRNDVKINVAYLDSHVRNVSVVNCSADSTSTTYVTTPMPTSGEPAFFNFNNELAKSATNPPATATATNYYDPRQYSDMLP